MSDDRELVERVTDAICGVLYFNAHDCNATPEELAAYRMVYGHEARAAIAAVRAYDAEQRAKVPTHDPDSDRECPSSLVSPPRATGGLTEFKRD